MALVVHFPGVDYRRRKYIISVMYDFYYKKKYSDYYINEFNNNISLLFPVTDGYDLSDKLMNFIDENGLKSVYNIFKAGESYNNNANKILKMKRCFDEHYDEFNEYVLYVDGGDTVLNLSYNIDEIKKVLENYNCKILFNSDSFDYPYIIHEGHPEYNNKDYFREDYNKIPNIENLRDDGYFLNSGVYFGKKEHIREMINEAYNLMITEKDKDWTEDQYIFKRVCKKLNDKYGYHFIEIDYKKELFHAEHCMFSWEWYNIDHYKW